MLFSSFIVQAMVTLDNLKGTYGTYMEAFGAWKIDWILALQYHEKLQETHTARDEVRTLVNDLVQITKIRQMK